MSDHDPVLNDADVRAMVRLLGKVAALDCNIVGKKRRLMSGLCELIGVEKWFWHYGVFETGDELGSGFNSIHDGWTDHEMMIVYEAQYDVDQPPPERIHILPRLSARRPVTRARWQELSDDEWYDLKHVQRYRKGLADDYIISFYPLPDSNVWSVTAMYRNWDGSRFTPRDVRIAHILMSEIPWLHVDGLPSDGGRNVHKLTPRQRTVLNMLLEAHGTKQIASHLGLSEWTVNDHIKAIYERFSVSSRSELLRRFFVGDGGDGL